MNKSETIASKGNTEDASKCVLSGKEEISANKLFSLSKRWYLKKKPIKVIIVRTGNTEVRNNCEKKEIFKWAISPYVFPPMLSHMNTFVDALAADEC